MIPQFKHQSTWEEVLQPAEVGTFQAIQLGKQINGHIRVLRSQFSGGETEAYQTLT